MRRREFITLFAGATAVWSLAARAQQATKAYRIAIVHPSASIADMSESGSNPYYPALFKELRRLGYIEGANLVVTFIGWEGVGLASYLLIGFWYERKSATDAGKKAQSFEKETAGVAVDPMSGDVYMIVNKHGVWKSTDGGKTFERSDGGKVSGRCETSSFHGLSRGKTSKAARISSASGVLNMTGLATVGIFGRSANHRGKSQEYGTNTREYTRLGDWPASSDFKTAARNRVCAALF